MLGVRGTTLALLLPRKVNRSAANLPADLLEEYDNVAFLVSRLRMPVRLDDLIQ